ncbi:hydrogen peroxide-inducible genes activator [Hyphobacterium sp.]|uniref:hydrogen peroxide-inducible genes activator n=1 Tax=Hyphobacterium sp. TaxID=2004662 RepID=UPI003B51AE86
MNTQLPTLRQLRFLVTLADEGNFSRAAEACHVTQPTLSAAIKELEATLGVTLVERGARGTTLTPAGEAAVARAWKTLAEAEDLVQAARAAGEPLSGPFHLGVIPTIAPFLLPKLLPVLSAAHERLQLYLREDLTERLLDGLRARNLDAALIALPYEAPGIESVTVGSDEFLFAAAADHPLASRDTVSANDLDGEKLLMLEDGHCLRDHALAVCSAAASRSDFAATSLHTLAQMVKSGLGATLLPRLAVEGGVTDGLGLVVKPFTPAVIGREIGIAWRKGSAREAEARLIAESLDGII